MDKFDKEIGVVSINLCDLATGPLHQDFMVKIKKVGHSIERDQGIFTNYGRDGSIRHG